MSGGSMERRQRNVLPRRGVKWAQVQKIEWKIADTFLFFETCTVTGDVPYGDHFQVRAVYERMCAHV